MTSVSQRLFARVTTVFIVSAVLHEVVIIPVSFQPARRSAPVLD